MIDDDSAETEQPWTGTNWCIDDYRVADGSIEFSGWAIPAEGALAVDLNLRVNGKKLRGVLGQSARPDLETLFPTRDGVASSGFRLNVRRGASALRPDAPLRISLSVGRQQLDALDYFFAGEIPPVPPGLNRHRVDGTDALAAFYVEGFTAFVKIGRAINDATGLSFDGFSRILDWGVGCGRIARYLPRPDRVVGVDVDPVNIAWCRENMPELEVHHVSTAPPTTLKAGSVDLVIGVSVLSHLRIPDMEAWIGELGRVTCTGAILALTTHGRVTFGRTTLGNEWFRVWQNVGFMDGGVNPNVDGASLDDEDFYHNVFMTRRFFRNCVEPLFEVLSVQEGVIGNSQDLFILRRR